MLAPRKTWCGMGPYREGEVIESEWELDALGRRVPRGTRKILDCRDYADDSLWSDPRPGFSRR